MMMSTWKFNVQNWTSQIFLLLFKPWNHIKCFKTHIWVSIILNLKPLKICGYEFWCFFISIHILCMCFALLCFALLCFALFCFALLCFALFDSLRSNSFHFNPIQFNPIQFSSVQFSSVQFNPIQFILIVFILWF